ncbi:unnamed protein product [Allacma fusca]|uniref:G-protein coupled receptors family 1 profile domain-containing protein n=1 Tax=Allacma fusca TaxID=39272 RepID=A0A8J2P631_9HEXA|nr:unnamed protein product [Allacma fusca]
MSIDRYLAIRHPMSRKIINRRTTRKVILLLWLIALLIFAPILYIRKADLIKIPIGEGEDAKSHEFTYCAEKWPDNLSRRTFGIFCFIIVYAIPGCVVVVAYSLMGLRLCSRQLLPEYQLTHGTSSSGGRNDLAHCDSANSAWQVSSAGGRLIRERRRVAKILLILALVFAFCWMPYSVLSLILDLKSPAQEERQDNNGTATSDDNEIASMATLLLPFAILLGHANSAVNPLLYCLLSKNFRRSVTELIRHPRRAVRGRQHCKILLPTNRY